MINKYTTSTDSTYAPKYVSDDWFRDMLKPNTVIPPSCENCSNHPKNGGSGICHCILGSPIIY